MGKRVLRELISVIIFLILYTCREAGLFEIRLWVLVVVSLVTGILLRHLVIDRWLAPTREDEQ